jgi:hypothetical protein
MKNSFINDPVLYFLFQSNTPLLGGCPTIQFHGKNT